MFKNKEELFVFLKPWFKNVLVFETESVVRNNLYFYASDGLIPFHKKLKNFISN